MQKNGFNRLIYGVMIACKAELKEYDAAYIWVKQLQKKFFAAQDRKPRDHACKTFLNWQYLPYDRFCVDTLFLGPLEILCLSSLPT